MTSNELVVWAFVFFFLGWAVVPFSHGLSILYWVEAFVFFTIAAFMDSSGPKSPA